MKQSLKKDEFAKEFKSIGAELETYFKKRKLSLSQIEAVLVQASYAVMVAKDSRMVIHKVMGGKGDEVVTWIRASEKELNSTEPEGLDYIG